MRDIMSVNMKEKKIKREKEKKYYLSKELELLSLSYTSWVGLNEF
jgi:hypothetical protein